MHLHAHSRSTTSLNGTWSAIPDQYEQFGDTGAFGGHRIYDPADQFEPIDADVDDGYDIAVPGCWNEELDGYEHYEGVMWYARRFGWDGDDDRVFLRFEAVNYRADVWLNGTHLGSHEGGFTPFAFEVTDDLEPRADNLLVVRVDDRRDRRALPAERTDWFTFGGITRDVELVAVPPRFVRNAKIETTDHGETVEVSVRAWVDGEEADETPPEALLPEGDRAWTLERAEPWEASPHRGTDEVTSGTVYEGTTSLPADAVDRWSPESPRLYDVHIRLGGDSIRERVGIRSVAVDGSDVLVNGETVQLQGMSMHEEAAGRGRSLTAADRQQRFEWLDELGCNFARLAHYPHHPAMARRADEAGVLLWAEVPAYWSVDFADPAVQAAYRQQLRELIERDWNRPSVALWSIANETDHEDETRNEVLTEMVAAVRSMDDSRLVTAACFVDERADSLLIADPLAEHLDVFGVNQYHGWYTGQADDLRRFEDDPSGPPILISEVGAGAKRGNHGEEDDRWTEEHQAAFYRTQLATLADIEQCCGLSPWILFDFKSPRRQNPHQRGYNRKGLLDERGRRKQAFDVVRAHYRS